MKTRLFISSILFAISLSVMSSDPSVKKIRILVITGGHSYNAEQFNQMLASLGDNISFKIAELPGAYDMFLPENRSGYDVLVFYHMWQKINDEQAKVFAQCIREGKPVVALHHSICAYDDWPEYFNIIGGKYFHKPATVNGIEYSACSYIHDVRYLVKVTGKNDPVTKGINNFEIFDETYKGYYIEPGVKPLLVTDEPTSNPVIGWSKVYGKAKIVTLQIGHDTPTYENLNFRRLLRQSIEWVNKE